jgi:serine/threonine-protein kinase
VYNKSTMNPERIGRYEIKSVLGRGGMATVYLAHDPSFGRDVAVKVLPGQFMHDPTFRARFEREARTIAALEHPAIVPVYDFGYEGDQPFLVMRQMPGGSLLDRMEGGPLPANEVSEILDRIGSSLDYAHRQGIIHRDLKPGNILFDRQGNAFLTDFGIAKLAESSATYTGSGIIGTPAYMSPEQIHGDKDLDSRSDIYALGIIVYEMLTGKGPYQADTPAKLMMAHVMSPVPHITETNPDLPPGYDTVITTAMAKERDDRYSTAGELSKAFEESSKAVPPAAATVLAGTMIEPAPDIGQTVVEQPLPIASTQQAQPIYQAPSTQVPVAAPAAVQPESEGGRKIPIWTVLIGVFALVLCLGLGTVGVLFGTGFFDGNGGDDEPTVIAVVATEVIEDTPVPPTDIPEPTDTPEPDTPEPEPTGTPEPEPTNTQEATKEPLTFAKVQDESGRISLQFPRQWESVTTDLGVWGSSDFDEWSDSFNMTREGDVTTPGLFLMALDEEDPVDQDFIEFFVDDFDFPENCDLDDVIKEDYDDGVYIGKHVTVICGSGEFVLLLAFDPNNPTFLIWLEAFILSVVDEEVLAKAFETFSVNPPSAVTETEPTATATSQPAAGGGGGGGVVDTPVPPPPQQDTRTVLLAQMQTTRADMARMGGMIDNAVNTGYISCQDVVRTYDAVANAPSFDISGSDAEVRSAHNSYRESIQVFTSGTSGLAGNCRTLLDSGGSGSIPFSQWGTARQSVNRALDIINPAIERLE